MITKEFYIRYNKLSDEYGLKEKFVVIQTGNTMNLSVLVGLDRFCNIVKPAIFTRECFVPLKNVSYRNKPTVRDIDNFLSGKKAVYSMLSNTMLICDVKGSLRFSNWVVEPKIDFYVPASIVSENKILATKVTSKPMAGCLTIPILEKVRGSMKILMAQSSVLTRAEYLHRRL